VTEALLDKEMKSQPQNKGLLIEYVMGISKTLDDSHLKLRSSIEMKSSTLLDLMEGGNYKGPARKFMARFTDREWMNVSFI